jgi:YHS domain-containing protein
MKTKMKTVVLLMTVLLVAAGIVGCKKKEGKTNISPAASAKVSSAAIEQTICPVEGAAINKNVYTMYKGKKVYFCCEKCKAAFEKEPEKYISKLPQFSK